MGTPVYKQAVVEKLASNLKKYMEEDNVVENKLYKQIFEQVADHGNNTNIMGIMDMETLGWRFDGLKKGLLLRVLMIIGAKKMVNLFGLEKVMNYT